MTKLWKNRHLLVLGGFVVGLVLVMTAWMWKDAQTDQTRFYNRGIIAYNHGDYSRAVQDFDLSYSDYLARVNARFAQAQAPASLEQAELAQEHKALALVKMEQYRAAVRTYAECLSLTTDYYMLNHHVRNEQVDPLSPAKTEWVKIKEDRKDCQTSLEILLRAKPDLLPELGQKGPVDPDADQTSEDPNGSSATQNRTGVNQ